MWSVNFERHQSPKKVTKWSLMTDCNLYKISPKESNQCNQCSVSSHQNQKLLIEQMTSAHNLLMCDAILKDWEWKWNIKIFHTYIYAFDKHVSCFMFLMYFPVLTETSDPERSDTSGMTDVWHLLTPDTSFMAPCIRGLIIITILFSCNENIQLTLR